MSALVVLNVLKFPGPSVNPLVPEERFTVANPFLRMWQNLKRQIVDDVPEALAICQFDCARARCLLDEGRPCEQLSRKAARELVWASPIGTPAPAFRVFSA
jgi:hypothetical protein